MSPDQAPGPVDQSKLAELRSLERRGNEGFVSRILGVFLEDARGRLDEISRAIGAGDPQAVALATHTLKGSCSYVGAGRLAELCRKMEATAEQGELDRERAAEIEQEFAAVSEALAAELQG